MNEILKRQNILDARPNTPVGLSYPLVNSSTSFFKMNYTTKEQIKTNLLMLLSTQPNERVMRPSYGIPLMSLLFENNLDSETIKDQISDEIFKYLPYITINEISISNLGDHNLDISLSYTINHLAETDFVELTI